jgi:pseudouridine synthase
MAKKPEQHDDLEQGITGPVAAWGSPRPPSARRRVSRNAPNDDSKPRPHDFTDSSRGPRLQKVLAAAGVASRRDCETLIIAGDVRVNGHLVNKLPAWVDPAKDIITVRGKKLTFAADNVYIMLFKPRGVVCTNEDPEGRRCAIDLVNHPGKARLFPVGRLDMDSSGLLLLTNDGRLAQHLTHPSHGVHQTYRVIIEGALTADDVEKLARSMFRSERRTLKDAKPARKAAPSRLKFVKSDRNQTTLLMELREGRNQHVERMFETLGHSVKKLRRIKLGPLKLGGLQARQWRELEPAEVKALRKAAKIK